MIFPGTGVVEANCHFGLFWYLNRPATADSARVRAGSDIAGTKTSQQKLK